MSGQEAILTFLSQQKDIHLGFSEILFVPTDSLKEFQPGYILIANDETGDPILIDTNSPNLRVCTATATSPSAPQATGAAHAQPVAPPEPIADSLAAFTQILTRLRILATGRENPVAKELNPLSAQEAQDFLRFVKAGNPNTDPGYWETLMLLALENDPE